MHPWLMVLLWSYSARQCHAALPPPPLAHEAQHQSYPSHSFWGGSHWCVTAGACHPPPHVHVCGECCGIHTQPPHTSPTSIPSPPSTSHSPPWGGGGVVGAPFLDQLPPLQGSGDGGCADHPKGPWAAGCCRIGGGGGLARSHGIVFSSAAGGAHWQIAIRCPSLPFPSVKVHQNLGGGGGG